jgi:hypothetical protein
MCGVTAEDDSTFTVSRSSSLMGPVGVGGDNLIFEGSRTGEKSLILGSKSVFDFLLRQMCWFTIRNTPDIFTDLTDNSPVFLINNHVRNAISMLDEIVFDIGCNKSVIL